MKDESRKNLACLILLVLLGAGVYLDSLGGKFLWDDEFLIVKNSFIKEPARLRDFFTQSPGAGAGRYWSCYRPLATLTYAADYALWKLNPAGFHLTGVLLHVLVTLSVFRLFALLFRDRLLAFGTAALFTVSPLHAGAVAYVSGRSDPLAALFVLLAFIFYVESERAGRKSFPVAAAAAYALALLSRENSLVFPLLLLAWHYVFRVKIAPGRYLFFPAAAALYLVARLTLLRCLFVPSEFTSTFFQRLPGFFAALTGYARLLLLPVRLHVEYGFPFFRFTDYRVILGMVLLALALAGLAIARRRSRLVLFAGCWFFLALLPTANLYPVNAYMAEHWLYLPSIGFFLLPAGFLAWLARERNRPTAAKVALSVLLVASGILAVKQNLYWRDAVTFYERTLKYVPRSKRMLNNLALLYERAGKYNEAIELHRRAIAVEPGFAIGYSNLSQVYWRTGRYEEALAAADRALEISPNLAEAYISRGLVYKTQGRHQESIAAFRKAVELKPAFAGGYLNLAEAYQAAGDRVSALAAARKAIEIDPNLAEAHTTLGNLSFAAGDDEGAISAFRRALEINPDSGTAHNNLAVVYYKRKKFELAIQHCDRAVALGYPVNPGFLKLINTAGHR